MPTCARMGRLSAHSDLLLDARVRLDEGAKTSARWKGQVRACSWYVLCFRWRNNPLVHS